MLPYVTQAVGAAGGAVGQLVLPVASRLNNTIPPRPENPERDLLLSNFSQLSLAELG